MAKRKLNGPAGKTSAGRKASATPPQQQQPAGSGSGKTDGPYRFRILGKNHTLTYEQAFAFGHTLLKGNHVREATDIFRKLAEVRGRGPRAKLMLAQCELAQQHYLECKSLLRTVFAGEDGALADELHDAFVYYRLGIRAEAINALSKFISKHQNFPTTCLILGDMFVKVGNLEKARRCFRLAIHRDRPGGAVAQTAQRQMKKLDQKASAAAKRTRAARKPRPQRGSSEDSAA